jgi:hypothetical protein
MAKGPWCVQFQVTAGTEQWEVVGPFDDELQAKQAETHFQGIGVGAKMYDMLDPGTTFSQKDIVTLTWEEPS